MKKTFTSHQLRKFLGSSFLGSSFLFQLNEGEREIPGFSPSKGKFRDEETIKFSGDDTDIYATVIKLAERIDDLVLCKDSVVLKRLRIEGLRGAIKQNLENTREKVKEMDKVIKELGQLLAQAKIVEERLKTIEGINQRQRVQLGRTANPRAGMRRDPTLECNPTNVKLEGTLRGSLGGIDSSAREREDQINDVDGTVTEFKRNNMERLEGFIRICAETVILCTDTLGDLENEMKKLAGAVGPINWNGYTQTGTSDPDINNIKTDVETKYGPSALEDDVRRDTEDAKTIFYARNHIELIKSTINSAKSGLERNKKEAYFNPTDFDSKTAPERAQDLKDHASRYFYLYEALKHIQTAGKQVKVGGVNHTVVGWAPFDEQERRLTEEKIIVDKEVKAIEAESTTVKIVITGNDGTSDRQLNIEGIEEVEV
ncbi:MAG TPA: hypothetical protein ENF20_05070 [Candidatus Marinimicrobia bacterium]|nr:hypothetical protein [Candidatus Neomarinimicrobiota bacterium]